MTRSLKEIADIQLANETKEQSNGKGDGMEVMTPIQRDVEK